MKAEVVKRGPILRTCQLRCRKRWKLIDSILLHFSAILRQNSSRRVSQSSAFLLESYISRTAKTNSLRSSSSLRLSSPNRKEGKITGDKYRRRVFSSSAFMFDKASKLRTVFSSSSEGQQIPEKCSTVHGAPLSSCRKDNREGLWQHPRKAGALDQSGTTTVDWELKRVICFFL